MLARLKAGLAAANAQAQQHAPLPATPVSQPMRSGSRSGHHVEHLLGVLHFRQSVSGATLASARIISSIGLRQS
jgi:hypothetical protein